jgi:hypothetical protein
MTMEHNPFLFQQNRINKRKALVEDHGSVERARAKIEQGELDTFSSASEKISTGRVSEVKENEVDDCLHELDSMTAEAKIKKRQPSKESIAEYRKIRKKEQEQIIEAEELRIKVWKELNALDGFFVRMRKAEYQLTQNQPPHLAAKLREGAKLVSLAEARQQALEASPETSLLVRSHTLDRYRKEKSSQGFVVTPSRRAYLDRIQDLIESGKPILLEGHTGTGKSELARIAAKELTGSDPEVVSCNPQTRISDIYGKQSLRSEDGVTVTAVDYGPLTRALESGTLVIFDEYNELDPRQRQVLKYLFNAKPGDSVDIPGDGKVIVKEGFGMLMTANLRSDKYQDKGALEPQESRVFLDSSIRVDYMPKEEVYDLTLASLMDEQGEILLTHMEGEETLKHFAEMVADIQAAFAKSIPSHYGTDTELDPKKKKRPSLEKYTLDAGMATRLLAGFTKERMQHPTSTLQEAIERALLRTLQGNDIPDDDKKLALLIFARYGFLSASVTGEALGLDYSDGRLKMTWPKTEQRPHSEEEGIGHLTRTEVASLDPFGERKRSHNEDIFEDFGLEAGTSLSTESFGESLDQQRAREIMGEKSFFGVPELEKAFGISINKSEVPDLPTTFTAERLEKAKEMGMMLMLRYPIGLQKLKTQYNTVTHPDGTETPLFWRQNWYNNQAFFTEEPTGTFEWALVEKEPTRDTKNKNYLEQTIELRKRLSHFFDDPLYDNPQKLSAVYRQAIEELEQKQIGIKDILHGNQQKKIEQDWKKAGQKLSSLSLNQMCRTKAWQDIYDIFVYAKNTGEYLREGVYNWTRDISSDGRVVNAGHADAKGSNLSLWQADDTHVNLGAVLSVSE